jgi:hypothetical protein
MIHSIKPITAMANILRAHRIAMIGVAPIHQNTDRLDFALPAFATPRPYLFLSFAQTELCLGRQPLTEGV